MNIEVETIHDGLQDLLLIDHNEYHWEKGTYLFQEGDKADSVYFICSGKIKIGKITPDGREITFSILKKGDLVSEIRLFCALSSYKVHAKVIEDAKVLKIQKEDLEENLLLNPGLTAEFIKVMGNYQQRTQTKFRDLILHGKKGALYSTLIRMSNSYGVSQGNDILIDLSLTNQELANFCGMSREVTNRMLNRLKDDGIISMESNRKILIHDLQYLKDEIHCEDCPADICSIN